MSTQVFDEVPIAGFGYADEFPVSVRVDGSPFAERRTTLVARSRRRYSWPLDRTNAERQAVDDFLRARGGAVEPFYVLDPRDDPREGVALGTGTGAQTTFPLPATGEEARFFPRQGTVVAYVNGTPVSVSSVATDSRTITLLLAPGMGAAVTADYAGLRLVRVEGPLAWTGAAPNWFSGSLELVEVRT